MLAITPSCVILQLQREKKVKSIVFATAAAVVALACSSACAEVEIDASWSAEVYSISNPAAPPIALSGSVTFFEPYIPLYETYTFSDGAYKVSLYTQSAHGSGVDGTVNVVGPDGSGPGLWSGGVTLVDAVPEPMTATLMLVGLGVAGFTARRRKR